MRFTENVVRIVLCHVCDVVSAMQRARRKGEMRFEPWRSSDDTWLLCEVLRDSRGRLAHKPIVLAAGLNAKEVVDAVGRFRRTFTQGA